MGVKYLWDTNTVIYYLQQQFPPNAEHFIDKSLNEGQPCISSITEIELLCWNTTSENDLTVLKNFISDCLVIELEKSIKLKTVEIRKAYRVKLPDAIIAASAIIYNLTLVTRNTKDFQTIEGLTVINPFEV